MIMFQVSNILNSLQRKGVDFCGALQSTQPPCDFILLSFFFSYSEDFNAPLAS